MNQAVMEGGGLCMEGFSKAWSEKLLDDGQRYGQLVKEFERSRGSARAVVVVVTVMNKGDTCPF